MSEPPQKPLRRRRFFRSPGFIGIRFRQTRGTRWGYLKIADRARHKALFSEREGINYKRLAKIGRWEIGLRP